MTGDWLSDDSAPAAPDPFAVPDKYLDANPVEPSPIESLAIPADWLDVPAEPAGGDVGKSIVEVTSTARLPYDSLRFECMKGSGRVWACDGEYVACRPSGFHDGTLSRHNRFLRAGHYEHVGTFDDVQVFRVLPGSPFYRTAIDLRQATFYEAMRGAAIAAVKRDWVLYTDILEELATRCKSTPTGTESGAADPGIARERWDFVLQQIFQQIYMRGGPSQPEVDAGMANVRRRRGFEPRVIALPSHSRMH